MSMEEMQEQIIKMQEQLKEFKTENETLKNKLTEKEEREKELMEHNQKLFLRITGKKEEETEEEEEIPFCIDKDIYDLLSDREKKELIDLIEEE